MSTLFSLSERVMESPFLGLVTVLSLVVSIILLIWIMRLERKLGRLLGKNGHSIEDSLNRLHAHSGEMKQFRSELEGYLENVETRLGKNIQAVETVRFNPFKGSGEGGNQSFATTFLNEKGDGVVLSSLYTRDRVSVYSKPVKKLKSEYELSEEEEASIEKASKALLIRKK
jgi:hypothetical protein